MQTLHTIMPELSPQMQCFPNAESSTIQNSPPMQIPSPNPEPLPQYMTFVDHIKAPQTKPTPPPKKEKTASSPPKSKPPLSLLSNPIASTSSRMRMSHTPSRPPPTPRPPSSPRSNGIRSRFTARLYRRVVGAAC